MRKLCGLVTVAMLIAGTVSAAKVSTTGKTRAVSTKSALAVGDQALNLKLAVKIGDAKSDVKQAKAGDAQSGKVEQTSAKVETSKRSSTKPKVLKPRKRRILVFKASWCSACQLLNYEWTSMKKVGWRVGGKLTDHIQLVDSDERPDLVSRYRITALPTLLLVDGDTVVGRQGSLSARNIAEFYYGRLK
jgi:thioredoxin 1